MPLPTLKNVSVIVPTRNRGESLGQTLRAILATNPAPLEVLVVDQSDPARRKSVETAAQTEAVRAGWSFSLEVEDQHQPSSDPGQLRLIQSVSRGASRARNLGASRALGQLVLFCDDDCLPQPDWVAAMAGTFAEEPDVWGVYGRVLPVGQADGTVVSRTNNTTQLFRQPTLPWYLGSGNNMAFRRSFLLEKAGGMDELLSIGEKFRAFEDIDIGYRALQMGGQIAYVPASLVYHNSPKSFREQLRTEAGYGLSVGAATVKYWRCGDCRAGGMLAAWVWQMGVRRSGAGLLKWRSFKVVRLALLQFWWPLVGLWLAHRQPVDRLHWLFSKKG